MNIATTIRSADHAANAVGPITVRHCRSFAELPQTGLSQLIPHDPESWDFFQSVEDIPPPGFELGALAAISEDRVIGLAPTFATNYRFDTPLQGSWRRATDWLNSKIPNITSLSVFGLGSPMTDSLTLGFDPDLTTAGRAEVFRAMLEALQLIATQTRQQLISLKSIDDRAKEFEPLLHEFGYNRVTSVPLVMLDLPFATIDEYLASLKPKLSKYLVRKNRTAKTLRQEYRDTIDDVAERINELHHNTLAQSEVSYGDFQALHPDYFSRVKHALGDKAQMQLTWNGDDLVSFQFFVIGKDRIVAKQLGMKYPDARELNLYFVNWLEVIRFAIEHRIPRLEMGATTYKTKLLFGGYLERRSLVYRFRRNLSNAILQPLASAFDYENNDAELKSLDEAHLKNMRGVW